MNIKRSSYTGLNPVLELLLLYASHHIQNMVTVYKCYGLEDAQATHVSLGGFNQQFHMRF